MGYQCEYSVLQCGEYELPQSRQRVFIWASLQGNPLPKFPEAICKFKGAVPSSPHRTRCGAPHAQITIGEAITDLPSFDWANPRNLNPYTAVDWLETIEMRIRAKKIPQVHITQDLLYAGNDRQPYASDPLTEYQRRIRKGASKIVHNHVTPAWYDHPTIGKSKSGDQALRYAKTEQICSIPMLPGADHRDLPKTLKSWWMYHKNSAAKRNKFYPGRFGRLSYEESFGVCLADIDPGGKNGKVGAPSVTAHLERPFY
jgi:site-specific DNA-cytosine methylase